MTDVPTKAKKRKSSGVIASLLWIVCLAVIAYLAFAAPNLDWQWQEWSLVICALAVTMDIATKLTIGIPASYVLGAIATFLGYGAIKLFRRLRRAISAWTKKEECVVRDASPAVAKTSAEIAAIHPKLTRGRTHVVLGYDAKSRPIAIDLSRSNTLMVASTRGGKTNALASLLIQLVSKENPPEIYVFDFKANLREPLVLLRPLVRYIDEIEEAIGMLGDLAHEMDVRQREGIVDPPILVIVDEVSDLTSALEREYRSASEHLLTRLSRKVLAAGMGIVVATQHARFDDLPKKIAYNFMREIVFLVDTVSQAEVALGFKPSREQLPQEPGEFLMRGEAKGLLSGKTLLVKRDEIDDLLASKLANFKDHRLQLWRTISLGRKTGNTVAGINATKSALHEENEWVTQPFVQCAYRNYSLAGMLKAPSKGGSYRLKVEFVEGVEILKEYLEEKKWQEDPPAMAG